MKTEKILSFIMPIYNPHPIVFPKVLKALVDQSLKNWEFIGVIDGDFPEAEKEIHKAFKKSAAHYKVVNLPHGGAQRARNEGLRRSVGEYVVFFDSDCVIEPGTAKGWYDIFESKPEIGFIYSGYRFLDEKGAIESEPFDPWMLRVRNYISMCFPLRRELVVPLNEDLESLQDWDFWLRVVAKGAKGKYLPGYAFATLWPTPKSISGQGCTNEKWLERMDKVKLLNNIPIREVCVVSLNYRLDGILLAKALDADYDDHPNFKPNHYKKIIQLGFSVNPKDFDRAATAWGAQHEKVIFWTAEDVESLYNTVSKKALDKYSVRINQLGKQFVEDKKALDLMTGMGFKVSILPLPVISKEEVKPLPEAPRFVVDISEHYGHAMIAIERAIPDIKLEAVGGVQKLEDYTGMVCFHPERLLRPDVKRMIAAGRHIVSNIQQPFCGYMNDEVSDGQFVKDFVQKIRETARKEQSAEAVKYYVSEKRLEALRGAI